MIKKPWVAALLAYLFPPLGPAYLNRGVLAWIYFAGMSLVMLIGYRLGISHTGTGMNYRMVIPILAGELLAAAHCFYLARKTSQPPTNRWYATWPALLAFLALPILIPLVVRKFLYEPFRIPSVAMAPQLMIGDQFVVSLIAYRETNPARGDVVVFRHPTDQLYHVARVIGLPGDYIEFMPHEAIEIGPTVVLQIPEGEQLVTDDKGQTIKVTRLKETLPEGQTHTILQNQFWKPAGSSAVVVPEGQYFLLKDNRSRYSDAQTLDDQLFKREAIHGKVLFKFWSKEQSAFTVEKIL